MTHPNTKPSGRVMFWVSQGRQWTLIAGDVASLQGTDAAVLAPVGAAVPKPVGEGGAPAADAGEASPGGALAEGAPNPNLSLHEGVALEEEEEVARPEDAPAVVVMEKTKTAAVRN